METIFFFYFDFNSLLCFEYAKVLQVKNQTQNKQ